MIPLDLLDQLVQDDDARRDARREVRPDRIRMRPRARPELPLNLVDSERRMRAAALTR